ncbi:unnamed protein product [marine sediment metagenome]|uniref:FAD-binding domain-containing protein n=1 Tax=marine sediment metagenome TaxID=412755 RepID=X1DGR2_9ZZZZ
MFAGDAAGLVDMYRGLGMDAAALSGRLVAKAIVKSEQNKISAIKLYEKKTRKVINKINKNSEKQLLTYKNNDELLQVLKKSFIKMGISTLFDNLLNKVLPANKIKLLPA